MHAGHGSSVSDSSKARLGLKLFFLYAIVYAGFVVINTVAPGVMGLIVFAGLNLAVIYGMGLIIFAIVLGLIYSQLATRMEDGRTRKARAAENQGGTR